MWNKLKRLIKFCTNWLKTFFWYLQIQHPIGFLKHKNAFSNCGFMIFFSIFTSRRCKSQRDGSSMNHILFCWFGPIGFYLPPFPLIVGVRKVIITWPQNRSTTFWFKSKTLFQCAKKSLERVKSYVISKPKGLKL